MRGAAICFACLIATSAHAQLSGSLAGTSDYRYRGITLSDRQPAAQGALTYDDPTGWFAGLFGSTVKLDPVNGPSSYFQAIAFAGYATRVAPGVSLEAGGDYAAFSGSNKTDYGEFFIGASTDELSARIYYSPRYFGVQASAVYAEINASHRLVDRVRLVAHAGLLHAPYDVGYLPSYRVQPSRYVVDGRLGLSVDLDVAQLDVAWIGNNDPDAAYRITGSRSPNTFVVTLSHSF